MVFAQHGSLLRGLEQELEPADDGLGVATQAPFGLGYELLARVRQRRKLGLAVVVGLGDIVLQVRDHKRGVFDPTRAAELKLGALAVLVQKRV
jgi:hypothetical protein